jgi:hypothetical protein
MQDRHELGDDDIVGEIDARHVEGDEMSAVIVLHAKGV